MYQQLSNRNETSLAGCFFPEKAEKKLTNRQSSNPLIVINRSVHYKVGVGDFVAKKEWTTSFSIVLRHNIVVIGNKFVLVLVS